MLEMKFIVIKPLNTNLKKPNREIIRQLSNEAVNFMKQPGIAPYDKGGLRTSIRRDYLKDNEAKVSPHKIYARVQNDGWPPPSTMRGSFKGHKYIERTIRHLDVVGERIANKILEGEL